MNVVTSGILLFPPFIFLFWFAFDGPDLLKSHSFTHFASKLFPFLFSVLLSLGLPLKSLSTRLLREGRSMRVAGWLAVPGPPQSPLQGKIRAMHFLNGAFSTEQQQPWSQELLRGCQFLPTNAGHAGKTPGFSDTLSS